MAKEKLVVIKEADITNNCPKCFNQELRLTFFQRHTYGRFFDKTTKDISHELKCIKCNSLIYPVDWTEDIERVYDYYKRLVTPHKTSIHFTSLFYILILVLIAIVATGAYFIFQATIGAQP